jgi:hypothetical protein
MLAKTKEAGSRIESGMKLRVNPSPARGGLQEYQVKVSLFQKICQIIRFDRALLRSFHVP